MKKKQLTPTKTALVIYTVTMDDSPEVLLVGIYGNPDGNEAMQALQASRAEDYDDEESGNWRVTKTTIAKITNKANSKLHIAIVVDWVEEVNSSVIAISYDEEDIKNILTATYENTKNEMDKVSESEYNSETGTFVIKDDSFMRDVYGLPFTCEMKGTSTTTKIRGLS